MFFASFAVCGHSPPYYLTFQQHWTPIASPPLVRPILLSRPIFLSLLSGLPSREGAQDSGPQDSTLGPTVILSSHALWAVSYLHLSRAPFPNPHISPALVDLHMGVLDFKCSMFSTWIHCLALSPNTSFLRDRIRLQQPEFIRKKKPHSDLNKKCFLNKELLTTPGDWSNEELASKK